MKIGIAISHLHMKYLERSTLPRHLPTRGNIGSRHVWPHALGKLAGIRASLHMHEIIWLTGIIPFPLLILLHHHPQFLRASHPIHLKRRFELQHVHSWYSSRTPIKDHIVFERLLRWKWIKGRERHFVVRIGVRQLHLSLLCPIGIWPHIGFARKRRQRC